jgi:hypothetical protein
MSEVPKDETFSRRQADDNHDCRFTTEYDAVGRRI